MRLLARLEDKRKSYALWYVSFRQSPYHHWLARWPVTVSQFAEYVRLSGSEPEDADCLKGDANSPVVWVSWNEAGAFCQWLHERWQTAELLPAGYGVGLPSEPEWEMAARGGERIPVEPLFATPGALKGGPDLWRIPPPDAVTLGGTIRIPTKPTTILRSVRPAL